MPLPPNRRPAKAALRKEEPPPTPAVNRRRKKFQFPLYILIMMTTVIGMALAPASYFMRAPDNHSSRMWYLILMLAWPMLMVIFIHTAVRTYHLLRRR